MLNETLGRIPFPPSGMLLVEPFVLGEMMKYQQLGARDAEAGGILLGYRRGTHLHIADLTTPMKKDVRSRYGFKRIDDQHQAIAVQRWEASGGELDYLGEWHTHPEPTPSPSPIDSSEWKKILRQHDRSMVFAIMGTSSDWWLGVGRKNIVHEVSKSEDG